MEFLEFVPAGVGILILVYVAARLVTAAFFKSKQQYEREKHHVQ
jgi:hypothetical protein